MQGTELLEGDVWGHRKDLDEYFTVKDTTMEEIRALVAGGTNIDDLASPGANDGQTSVQSSSSTSPRPRSQLET